jgi:DNA-binding MurR/RpiR family transcriptional regulator
MGFDDLINKAKDLLGQSEAKTQEAAESAAAGDSEAAAAEASEAGGLIDKAKEMLTDERIDQVAGAIKDKTPDNIDTIVDQVAAKGKEFNN